MNKPYQFYYWPIQGRGEFVRLALEAASAQCIEVTRQPESEGGGVQAMMRLTPGTGDLGAGPGRPCAAAWPVAGALSEVSETMILRPTAVEPVKTRWSNASKIG